MLLKNSLAVMRAGFGVTLLATSLDASGSVVLLFWDSSLPTGFKTFEAAGTDSDFFVEA